MDRSRYEYSYATKKGSGTSNGFLDFSKANGDVVFYKKKEGPFRLNIVSYIIKSNKHPMVARGIWKIGQTDYRLDVSVHRRVGPGEHTVVCPKRTYGKPCPICDRAEEYRRNGEVQAASALYVQRLCLYNIIDLDEPEKGIQIAQLPHSLFEAELIDEAKARAPNGDYIGFADEKDGYSIHCRGVEIVKGPYKFIQYKSFEFVPRKEDLTPLVPKAHSLDNLLIVYDAKKLKAILDGDDEEEVLEDVIDENVYEADSLETESNDSWEPETYEKAIQEELKKEPSKPLNNCPHGHVFGKDNDKFPECDECSVWKQCARAAR